MALDLPSRCRARALREIPDERGSFLKLLMREHLPEPAVYGESYLTSAVRGAVKGDHYHEKTSEWFIVIRGAFTLWLEDLDAAEPRRHEVHLTAAQPTCIFVPPRVAHAFENRHEELAVLFAYADRPYDPNDTDTFPVNLTPTS